jgi:hypothetical protein
MEQDHLRWTDPEEAVKLARESGFTTRQIVRIVSGALSYREALKVAGDYAPLLDITVSEFMRLRRND